MTQDAARVIPRSGMSFINQAFAGRQAGSSAVKTETLRLTPEEASSCATALANYKHSTERPLDAMDIISSAFPSLVRVVRNSRKDSGNLSTKELRELREFGGLVSLMMKDLGIWCHDKEYDVRTMAFGLVTRYPETMRQLEILITTSMHEDIHSAIVRFLTDEISRLKLDRIEKKALPRVGDLSMPDYCRRLLLRAGVLSRFVTARRGAVISFADSMDMECLDHIARNCSSGLEGFKDTRDLANAKLEELQANLRTAGIEESDLLKRFVSVVPTPRPAVEGGKVVLLRPRQQDPDPGGDGGGTAAALPKPDEGEELDKAA